MMSLPLSPALTDEDVSSVGRAVRAIVEQERR
jgi:dTDP-4-amino-4,6-dideoxygalactose transaminase